MTAPTGTEVIAMTHDEFVAYLADLDERIDQAKARKSPSIRLHHRRQCEAAAAAEAEMRAIEDHQSSPERDAERFGPKDDPRWVLPDRPYSDPLLRDRGAM